MPRQNEVPNPLGVTLEKLLSERVWQPDIPGKRRDWGTRVNCRAGQVRLCVLVRHCHASHEQQRHLTVKHKCQRRDEASGCVMMMRNIHEQVVVRADESCHHWCRRVAIGHHQWVACSEGHNPLTTVHHRNLRARQWTESVQRPSV